ncbi:MAG: acetyl-CoA carboxylase biotin carboxyl carrier protein subunit [candidate division Zixibacteria bacterium HGW-Zixibacteria-1]|nr:MAG: acetyl-CoA carboxylase biotin carboxyl carrier protein subunit [candidate division Zixibacteria bacterium HGW-Zixibacteria-1]
MKLKITVHGVAYEVEVEVLDAGEGFPAASSLPRPRTRSQQPTGAPVAPLPSTAGPVQSAAGGAVASPIAGTIVEIKCKAGDTVSEGQVLLIIEAMKMKTSIAAPTSGKVKNVPIAVGDTVRESQTLVELE